MIDGGAAAAAAIANAIRASGVLVKMEVADFLNILAREERPTVVVAPPQSWTFRRLGAQMSKYRYLTSWRGLAFWCETKELLDLPAGVDVIQARSIHIPA